MLAKCITTGFPSKKSEMPAEIQDFWEFRQGLSVSDTVVLYNDRIVIPESPRENVSKNLHSAHQGTSGMFARALATVFWPGLTASLEATRGKCRTCHRNVPTQARLPPTAPDLPKIAIRKICADFFKSSHGRSSFLMARSGPGQAKLR